MEPEVWSVIVAAAGVAVALVAGFVAVQANRKAYTANQIASDANQLASDANTIARRALGIEEDRDRSASRPKLHVQLGEGHQPRASFDVRVWHEGTQPIEVQLRVTEPATATFFPGIADFMDQGSEPLPQDEERYLGMLGAGESRALQILWRDFEQRTTTILSSIRRGEETWEERHELNLDEPC